MFKDPLRVIILDIKFHTKHKMSLIDFQFSKSKKYVMGSGLKISMRIFGGEV